MKTYALVTGSSKGIGKAIAEQLAARGINLILVARSQHLLLAASLAISSKYHVDVKYLIADLSDTKSPQYIFDWCTAQNYSVNILINNAGFGLCGKFDEYTSDENLNMMQVNMQAPVHLCHLFIPELAKYERSYILNVASSAAYQAVPGLSLYAASKAFILNFSRGLRQDLKSTNISVSCLSPGATDTEFIIRANVGERGKKSADLLNMTPEQVARIAVTGMFNNKTEIVAGWINKLSVFFSWLLPKIIVEKIAMKLYR